MGTHVDRVSRGVLGRMTLWLTLSFSLALALAFLSVDYWDSSKCPPVRTYMQRIGLIPSDEDTSSTGSVGARFGGSDRGEEGSGAGEEEGEDSIEQGPWGLAAYAFYWWSGATGQTDRFTRSWSAFMNVWNSY